MESSPFLHPAFLLTAGSLIVGVIIWLVRLEGKATAALTENQRLERENAQIWSEIERHKDNQDIHFNQKVSAEVEKGNTRRFETIEHQLTEINSKLDRLASKGSV